jgi:hypothetical protein
MFGIQLGEVMYGLNTVIRSQRIAPRISFHGVSNWSRSSGIAAGSKSHSHHFIIATGSIDLKYQSQCEDRSTSGFRLGRVCCRDSATHQFSFIPKSNQVRRCAIEPQPPSMFGSVFSFVEIVLTATIAKMSCPGWFWR